MNALPNKTVLVLSKLKVFADNNLIECGSNKGMPLKKVKLEGCPGTTCPARITLTFDVTK